MTLDELDALYDQANRLILGRSATAAGKALVFSSSSLDDAASEIADLYGLTSDERSILGSTNGSGALSSVQETASGLVGGSRSLDAAKAVSIAKTAIESGRTLKAASALLKAGPKAAEAAAAGGQLAGKATVWGWIATAAYAAGTGSWFAYNLRSYNLAAYEARRVREGIEAPPRASIRDVTTARVSAAAGAAGDGARAIGESADAAMRGAAKGGGRLLGAAGGLLRGMRSRIGSGGAATQQVGTGRTSPEEAA
jgi:hypothetical protein